VSREPKFASLSALIIAGLLAGCSSPAGPSKTGGQGDEGGTGGDEEGGKGGTAGKGSGGSGGTGGQKPPADAGAGGSTPPDAGASGDAGGCAAGNLLCNPSADLPKTLKETGLFPSFPDMTKPADNVRWYHPDPELYSDGLHKDRWIVLPKGMKIDTSDRKNWVFPVGTLFVKTFSDDGPNGKRPVETRVIRPSTNAFEPFDFAVYKWNADGTAASLLDNAGMTRTPVPVKVGTNSWMHTIPSRIDCGECHEKAHLKDELPVSDLIGFDEIRLNGPGQTGVPNQLKAFTDLGFFTAAPPATAADIRLPNNKVLEGVERFVYGNCVHCHNAGNDGVTDFTPEVFLANTVNKEATSHVMPPAGWKLVVPGKPLMSVVYVQALGTMLPATGNLRPMPPVGVEVRTTAPFTTDLDNLKAWITSGAK
jgi:hypothetical protein